MRPAGNMEKLVKNVDIDTNAKMDEAVIDDVLKAFEQSKAQKSTAGQPSIWRIIMKSRITKLAAAAVIIIGVIALASVMNRTIPTASASATARNNLAT